MGMSKGVQVYFFSAVEGCKVEFSVPGQTIERNQLRSWSNDHLEIDKDKLDGLLSHVGRFSFKVLGPRGAELTSQWVDVDVLTGNLKDGTMTEIEKMRSVTQNGMIVSYGFYDAGHGEAGLPNAHQCHVTVEHMQDGWMGAVAPRGSPQAQQRATAFAMPAAHDPGMSTLANVDSILRGGKAKPFTELLAKYVHIKLDVDPWVDKVLPTGYIRDVIFSLSGTQKDDIATMLSLGVRYFEFRPGKLPQDYSGLDDKDYFLHLVIPGLAYDSFLDTVFEFLGSNPDEIVVVQLRSDGIPDFIPRFDEADMDKLAQAAVDRRKNGVQVGNAGDLCERTIQELRESNRRLLITKQAHVSQYSSYDDDANATLVPGPMLKKFDEMDPKYQEEHNPTFTVIQCQATATNIKPVLEYSIVSSDASTSVMMATKAICDTGTHPWIQEHGAKLSPKHTLVVMNDFIDGATCDVAIELSKKRFQALGEQR